MATGYRLERGDLTALTLKRYIRATMHTAVDHTIAFQLKGGLYPFTALQLLHSKLEALETQLIEKIRQAPKFFYRAPVVVDLQLLPPSEQDLAFDQLLQLLQKHHLIPVGLKGGSVAQQAAAGEAGFAILQDASHKPLEENSLAPKPGKIVSGPSQENDAQDNTEKSSRVIYEPVRSGQQIYARGGDLVVLAAVSHGAELLADGHIHVYGPLRGRALAGVSGDQNAHIFCQSLEAELISIAGQYKISEDIEKAAWRMPVDISIVSGHLQIRAL